MKEYTYRTRRNIIAFLLSTIANLAILTGTTAFFLTHRKTDFHFAFFIVSLALICELILLPSFWNLFRKVFYERIVLKLSGLEFYRNSKRIGGDWNDIEKLFRRNRVMKTIEYTLRFRGFADVKFDTSIGNCDDLVKAIQKRTGRAFVAR
jgi:hypothetical protein